MFAIRGLPWRVVTVGGRRSSVPIWWLQRAGVSIRTLPKAQPDDEDSTKWPRKIFSGIQPTGTLHLGNYLGAVQKWTKLQNASEDVTYCIVDMHSITVPQNPSILRENIFQMAATMLACGIDADRSTVFVQSAVREHTELCWILGCLSTLARLGHLPQFKEKTRLIKDVPLGLFVYPVLQAADIMLYKATHVPVGEDQVQHIQLTQHLSKIFNKKYGTTFPICHAIIEDKSAARIRSLRDPSKKMSKSDPDPRATINLLDTPEVIIEKFKKSLTDFTSDVSYDPETRQGVSNMIAIHSLVTGKPIKKIVEEARALNTGIYKLRVAEAVIEHLKPIRIKVNQQLERRRDLQHQLELGAEKARQIAQNTMAEVQLRMGLGAQHTPIPIVEDRDEPKEAAAHQTKSLADTRELEKSDQMVVPRQQLRVEKKMEVKMEMFKLEQMLIPKKNFAKPLPKKETHKALEVAKDKNDLLPDLPTKEIKI